MKQIKLYSQKYPGLFTQVDDEDYDRLNQYHWNVHNNHGYGLYVKGKIKGQMIYIHRLILLNCEQIDHIDGNGLNNQKSNLRSANHSLNAMNRVKTKETSEYKGVYWNKCNKKWQANIKVNQKLIYLGRFINEIDAAKAYNKKAKELFGKYANLNGV